MGRGRLPGRMRRNVRTLGGGAIWDWDFDAIAWIANARQGQLTAGKHPTNSFSRSAKSSIALVASVSIFFCYIAIPLRLTFKLPGKTLQCPASESFEGPVAARARPLNAESELI
jgi:hypothetical protein